jgi:hypothetical protein
MTEICDRLIICSQEEFNHIDQSKSDYSIAFCAKHPFHQYLVGYKGNLPKTHPEYLIAKRPERHMIAANLIDVDKDGFVSDTIIQELIDFIDKERESGRIVLLVCNQGVSRSSCVGLMYLLHIGMLKEYKSFFMLEQAYREIYPRHNPSLGMQLYTARYWDKLRKMEEEINHD